MRVFSVPLSACDDLFATHLDESRRPVGNGPAIDERLEKRTKCLGPRGKELRTVIEFEGIGTARRQSASDAAGFFENHDVVSARELARHDEPGKSGTDDRDGCHVQTITEPCSKQ